MIFKRILELVIGKKNKKYLNKYLLMIVVIHIFNKITTELVKGNVVDLSSVLELVWITLAVLILGFRIWIGIFEGTQKFWIKVLKIEI